MAALYLSRQGNAGIGGPEMDDHDRWLNAAGERAYLALGRHFAARATHFDTALCSNEVRTRQAMDQVAGYLDRPPRSACEPALYLCSAVSLQTRIRACTKLCCYTAGGKMFC